MQRAWSTQRWPELKTKADSQEAARSRPDVREMNTIAVRTYIDKKLSSLISPASSSLQTEDSSVKG